MFEFPSFFISATKDFCKSFYHVNAPYIRKEFDVLDDCEGEVVITGLGFYRLFLNGEEITKGILAPYISAPSDVIGYDKYKITAKKGKNVLGIILGNGMQNAFGAVIWDFHTAKWRGAPKTAFRITTPNGVVESDLCCKCHPSPITFDDLRAGEHYDARLEIKDWSTPEYDDSAWESVIPASDPGGVKRFVECEPIATVDKLTAVSITKVDNRYIYDFGINTAGNILLKVKGKVGQKVTFVHGEMLDKHGRVDMRNIVCDERQWQNQTVEYTFGSENEETYTPAFTYNGFRYVEVDGFTDEQATSEAVTYLVQHSDIQNRGYFKCSDEIVNALERMTENSTLSNFWYFPNDCPHREKNGWTGDAALSCEQTLLSHEPENSYEEWLVNIRAAQKENGTLPGIVPTGGWGFHWGNGPAWDSVLTFLPYYTYIYRGNKKILEDNADAIDLYITYMQSRLDEKGLAHYGLGDWCQVESKTKGIKAPLEVTDTMTCIEILKKASFIFKTLGQTQRMERADKYARQMISASREHLVDFDTMTVKGNCQTSQAMALNMGVFNADEFNKAYAVLKKLIADNDNMHECGILGCRVLFELLAENGDVDLALEMIASKKFPAFGSWAAAGETSLWECFDREGEKPHSKNHHMYGAISTFFYRQLAGIRITEDGVKVQPKYPEAINFVEAQHRTNTETIYVRWERHGDDIITDIKRLPIK